METNETLKVQNKPLMGEGQMQEIILHFLKPTITCTLIGDCIDYWCSTREMPFRSWSAFWEALGARSQYSSKNKGNPNFPTQSLFDIKAIPIFLNVCNVA